MTLNYERFEAPAAMVEECDGITLGDLRSRADTLDRLYIDAFGSELGDEGVAKLYEEFDGLVVDTLKSFTDRYEGRSAGLMLSGLLHLALTSVYTVEYQLSNMWVRHEADEIMEGE